jgi:hypothetical protein
MHLVRPSVSALLLFLAVTAFSQPSRDDLRTEDVAQRFSLLKEIQRDNLWREDVAQAVSFVIAQHPSLFTNVTREQFQDAQDTLLNSIPQKSDAQVLLGLQHLLALAHDGHTAINLFQNRTPLRRFPLRFYWFSDGIFVTDAGAAYAAAVGARLLRVQDTPVDEAVSQLALFISHENEWWVRSQAPLLLSSPEALFAAGIASEESAPVRLALEDASGRRFAVSVEAVATSLFALPHKARPNPPLYRRSPERFYWFEYLEGSRTLYVKYNSCQNSPLLSMRSFVDEIGLFAGSNPIERAVIDIRNNGGGDSSVVKPLTDLLAQALAAGVISKDRLFVILGRDTFSSGLLAAIDFKRLGATLVGEPSGNSPSHFGNTRAFVLPNSRLTMNCSTRWFSFPDFPGAILTPDISAELAATDFFNERDPGLAAILP